MSQENYGEIKAASVYEHDDGFAIVQIKGEHGEATFEVRGHMALPMVETFKEAGRTIGLEMDDGPFA